MASVLLEARPYRPFKSSEEYLEAMREDLAEWLNTMYPELMINADNFMDRLDTGVALCKHANNVRQAAEDYLARRQARNKSMTRSMTSGLAGPILAMGNVHYLPAAKSGTFFARDNVSNFITWCRKALKIFECLLFETDDLIMRKNEKHVILCLLEVARRGAKFGMLAPMLVQMERQIDREIAADNKAAGIGCGTQTDFNNGTNNTSTETEFDTDTEDEDDNGPMLVYGPQPQIITNDLKSLDEMVRDLVEKCTCPSQFPMVRVSEGKYRIGDTKVLIFVRILRSHVMVRVGGGWDTLSHYLDKHDPCRCRAQHRSSVAARLIPRTNNQTNGIELHKAQVIFERSPPVARRIISNLSGNNTISNNHHTFVSNNVSTLSPPTNMMANTRGRSRSPTPQRKINQNNVAINHQNSPTKTFGENTNTPDKQQPLQYGQNGSPSSSSPNLARRSVSPSPRKFADLKRKQQTATASLESGANFSPTSSSKISSGIDLETTHVHFENLSTSSPLNHHDNNGSNKTIPPIMDQNTSIASHVGTNGQLSTENSTKFENISDNGSEISDEGYRSLGIIQSGNNAQKRESLHSQTSVEDAENNVRLDQNSSDSQISPTDEQESSTTKTPENLDSNCTDLLDSSQSRTPSPPEQQEQIEKIEKQQIEDQRDSVSPSTLVPKRMSSTAAGNNTVEEPQNSFEQSGVFITDDEITVDIASATGLRKTGFSDKIYGSNSNCTHNEDNNGGNSSNNSLKKVSSKIPRSPVPTRRRSVDNSSDCGSDLSARTGLPVFNRKQPIYRSVRKPISSSTTPSSSPITSSASANNKQQVAGTVTPPLERKSEARVKNVTNTWSGRTTGAKSRPAITSDTFTSPNGSNFTRQSKVRSSAVLYDSNGRRIRGGSTSLTTSPIKNSATSSPLAQQLLEAAGNAKNDAQILEKMKQILTQYSNFMNNSGSSPGNKTKNQEFDDFTTAWVHSNGTLDRSSTCSPPTKGRSKRSSAASSTESTHSKDNMSVIVTSRRDRGLSRIPAPVRNHTELY